MPILSLSLVRHSASHNAIEFAFTTNLAPFALSHIAFDYTSPGTTCIVLFHPVSFSHEWGAVHLSDTFSNASSLSLCSLISSFAQHLQTSPELLIICGKPFMPIYPYTVLILSHSILLYKHRFLSFVWHLINHNETEFIFLTNLTPFASLSHSLSIHLLKPCVTCYEWGAVFLSNTFSNTFFNSLLLSSRNFIYWYCW